jgi:membrane-bound ClpP family serine protease
MDVISDGQFVERGQQVKVIRIQGNVIVVAPVEEG